MTDRVVIFGGTFNPVHFGHLIVARSVAEHFGAARVMLVPAATPPHKDTPLAAPAHRLAMLNLAVGDDPLFEVSTVELDRSGVSYTYDTLVQLGQSAPDQTELMWIIGMDMLADLATWYRADDVVAMARIVTVVRPPMPADLDAVLAPLASRFGAEQVRRLAADILPAPLIDISSTDIRRRVAAGKSIAYLTAGPIVQYVEQHRLYGASS